MYVLKHKLLHSLIHFTVVGNRVLVGVVEPFYEHVLVEIVVLALLFVTLIA